MNDKLEIGITDKEKWNEKWNEIFKHYQNDKRHAYYINAFIKEGVNSVLEIGAGSVRDVECLNMINVNCFGIDYSKNAVDLAKELYPKFKNKFFEGDAFNMNMFADNQFDLSYHNGFWILFNNDNDIKKLLEEQIRVTKDMVIATVQNKNNDDFVKYFDKLSIKDPLYKIRFFSIDEMIKIMSPYFKKIEIIPVGKGKKYFEDEMINKGDLCRDKLYNYFNAVGLKHLQNSERLLCIGYK